MASIINSVANDITFILNKVIETYPLTGNYILDNRIMAMIMMLLTYFILNEESINRLYAWFTKTNANLDNSPSSEIDRIYFISDTKSILQFYSIFKDDFHLSSMDMNFKRRTLEYSITMKENIIKKELRQRFYRGKEFEVFTVMIDTFPVLYFIGTSDKAPFICIPHDSQLTEQVFFDFLVTQITENRKKSLILQKQKIYNVSKKYQTQNEETIAWGPSGNYTNIRHERSIITNSGLEILEDVNNFMKNEEIYKSLNMNRKKTYLLYGPPGTGKSSIISTVATKFNLPVFRFTFREELMFDKDYLDAQNQIDQDCIILLDDIPVEIMACEEIKETITNNIPIEESDSESDSEPDKSEDKKKKKRNKKKITKIPTFYTLSKRKRIEYSTLLEFMDDRNNSNNCVKLVFICTNFPEKIKPELIRPGRVDKINHCNYMNEQEIKRYFKFISSVIKFSFDNQIEKFLLHIKESGVLLSYGLLHVLTTSLIIQNKWDSLMIDLILQLSSHELKIEFK